LNNSIDTLTPARKVVKKCTKKV